MKLSPVFALAVFSAPSVRAFTPTSVRLPPSQCVALEQFALSAAAPYFATNQEESVVGRLEVEDESISDQTKGEDAEVAALHDQIATLLAEAAAFERQAEALEEEAATEAARVRTALGEALDEAAAATTAAASALDPKAAIEVVESSDVETTLEVALAGATEAKAAATAALEATVEIAPRQQPAQGVRDGIADRAIRRMSLRERLGQIEGRDKAKATALVERSWAASNSIAAPSPAALVRGDTPPSPPSVPRQQQESESAKFHDEAPRRAMSLREIAMLTGN